MFKRSNFCHVASNNRNNVKAGLFVYRTTDDLDTVTASGYFNDMIIDINLHDLIIHEQIDSSDNTKVQRNLLCVTEKTLENVGTSTIKSAWEEEINELLNEGGFVKTDGSSVMTGALKFSAGSMRGAISGGLNGLTFFKMDSQGNLMQIAHLSDTQFVPASDNTMDLGTSARSLKTVYVKKLNNGYDINVPVTASADTLALKSQVDDAANSGEQLYTTGVWYAKMYAATTVPTGAEYDGRNYADFSQVDGDNNPVIKIYTGASGAWTLTQTITPPANHNGYITVTSKIWDIAEQSGQQGGQVLWSHNTKTFTPYPRIISFENAALTGVPTAPLADSSSPNNQIATKEYVDNATANSGSGLNVGDIFLTMRNDNELNGAVECDGSTYNTTDFTGAQSIGQLLADGKVPYVSMAVYASTVATQGWCDKFGWDGTGNVQFKVPTLSAYIWQKLQLGIKGSIGSGSGGTYFVATQSSFTQGTHPDLGGYGVSVTNDQTIPGASVDITSEDVSQQRCMVQLATSATDEALETCTAVTAQVAANTAAIAGADYVVESQLPTAQNNYTWYRKYKSGWVEQGGVGTQSGSTSVTATITFPVAMADTNYVVSFAGRGSNTSGGSAAGVQYTDESTTGMKIYTGNAATSYTKYCWEIKGVAA